MKRSDYLVLFVVGIVVLGFATFPVLGDAVGELSKRHAYLMSFVKFAVLASFGECLALRIVKGVYWQPGFGLGAKIVVWGVLGMGIKAALVIFAAGVPHVLASLGLGVDSTTMAHGNWGLRLALALSISVFLNTLFAPVFMTLHKITDGHIRDHGGLFSCMLTPIDMSRQLKSLDWNIMWGFVFKKTIPFFWIPAHTITFMLPPQFRVLFAAMLGIVLGVILAFAGLKAKGGQQEAAAA